MSSVCVAIENFKFSASDKILFDTNIWYFLFGSGYRSDDQRVTKYSRAYHRLLSAGGNPYVDKLVLSEYVNRHAQTEYGYWRASPGNTGSFKDFRDSADFDHIVKAIRTCARKIMKHSIPVNSTFPPASLDGLLDKFVTAKPDFNDLLLAATCQECNLKIMTDDADFKRLDVEVLTANTAMLR